jgi:gamma-aminobutyric acid receptor subunit epsilon
MKSEPQSQLEPQPSGKKLPAKEPELTVDCMTERPGGKLTRASRILNTILSNYDHKLRPGIGGELMEEGLV